MGLDLLNRQGEIPALAEQNAERLFDLSDSCPIKASPLEPNNIYPTYPVLPVHNRIGGDIPAGSAEPPHQGELSYTNELMHDAIA